MSDKFTTSGPAGFRKSTFLSTEWGNVLGRLLALIIVFAFFALAVEDGKFYTLRNLESILRQSCVYATAGLGMTMVIIAAGIDLSAGSMIALSVVSVAWVLNLNGTGADGQTHSMVALHPTLMPILAVIAGVVMATLAGVANGAMIVGLRLMPFIVTLGTMGMIRGFSNGIAKERDIYPPEQTWINSIMDPTLTNPAKRWMILPLSVWILLACVLVSLFLLRYTRLGRHIFAVGSNEETARLCGVSVNRTKLFVYTASGFFCGVAGLMQFSYIGIGQPTTGVMYELLVIAAVVIGGASFTGGEGSILGTLIGALTITVLSMGGKMMGWPKWVQEVVISAIIIVAVALGVYTRYRLRQRDTS